MSKKKKNKKKAKKLNKNWGIAFEQELETMWPYDPVFSNPHYTYHHRPINTTSLEALVIEAEINSIRSKYKELDEEIESINDKLDTVYAYGNKVTDVLKEISKGRKMKTEIPTLVLGSTVYANDDGYVIE